MKTDNWQGRESEMKCATCMWWIAKFASLGALKARGEGEEIKPLLGRCRRHSPYLGGWPAVYADDWCGDHKLDENV